MLVTDEVRRLAARDATAGEIETAALAGGMLGLWADGLDKVTEGLTTIDELRRVLILEGGATPDRAPSLR